MASSNQGTVCSPVCSAGCGRARSRLELAARLRPMHDCDGDSGGVTRAPWSQMQGPSGQNGRPRTMARAATYYYARRIIASRGAGPV